MKSRFLLGLVLSFLFEICPTEAAPALKINPTVRVALVDFSTDDNSYRSIAAAAEFTSLLQIGLKDEPQTEWVERAQIRLAKTEFALAEMKAAGSVSPIQRGRMLHADWMVTGHFSTDDRERPTLSLQVIEMEHADVIANETVVLPELAREGSVFGNKHVDVALISLRRLLGEARANEARAVNQMRLAFLFLADTSQFSFGRGPQGLGRELAQALERRASTNRQVRLIKFSKAYQTTEESEMAVDGIIEASRETWRQTADLYVWGKYVTTNSFAPGRREFRLEVELSLWNGVGAPAILKESLALDSDGRISANQTIDLVNRLVGQIMARVTRAEAIHDSVTIRKEIAASIIATYVGMTGPGRSSPGLHDREKFVEAVHMLETACFFDPNNADARLLWITSRYGWWMDFRFDVKNQFWSMWRRKEVWKDYVERFGFQSPKVALPFPYHGNNAVSEFFVRSLEEVIEIFPQWHASEEIALEDQWRKEGTHTWLMEAEYHGFPKEMPYDLSFSWRKELEAELNHAKKRVAEFSQTNASRIKAISRQITGVPVGALSNQVAQATNRNPPGITRNDQNPINSSQMVATPNWMKNYTSLMQMFRLYPPNLLPLEVKPEKAVIRFPPRYEVRVIRQLEFHGGKVWILAMDERSAPSSASKPELAAERKDETSRLWCLAEEAKQPELFKANELPSSINAMLFQNDRLWLGGDSLVVLDLTDQSVRKFGIAEGLALREVEALTMAGTQVFVAGDSFDVSSFDAATAKWKRLQLPTVNLEHGNSTPYVLTGNGQWLGYVARATLFLDLQRGTWTNLVAMNDSVCFANERERFWAGGPHGLHCFDTTRQVVQSWSSPTFLQSPMLNLVGTAFTGNAQMPKNRLAEVENRIHSSLEKLDANRRRMHLAKTNQSEPFDPFHMGARVPGSVAALANDGDFLWLGVNNYFGSYLLLLHKPSLSLVAGHTMGVRETISSLMVSDRYVWVGTSYGDSGLLRMHKDAFLSVPRNEWLSIVVTSKERQRIVQRMSKPDQALYAFYAGDDAAVVQLLSDLEPEKAGLSEMFLLAWSFDASGVDNLSQCRTWFDLIGNRFPDSPWARYASAAAKTNEVAHEAKRLHSLALARFDRNHDGILDDSEKQAMKRDPAYAQEQQKFANQQTTIDMEQIVKRYDSDGDARLDLQELKYLRQTIAIFFEARQTLKSVPARKRLLDPLVTERTPSAEEMLRQYDADQDGKLSAAELSVLAEKLRKK